MAGGIRQLGFREKGRERQGRRAQESLPVKGTEAALQGYLAHKNPPPSLWPPYGTRQRATVGSYGGVVSYERGTPVGGPPALQRWLAKF